MTNQAKYLVDTISSTFPGANKSVVASLATTALASASHEARYASGGDKANTKAVEAQLMKDIEFLNDRIARASRFNPAKSSALVDHCTKMVAELEALVGWLHESGHQPGAAS